MACSSQLEVPTFSSIHCCYSDLLIVLTDDFSHSVPVLSVILKEIRIKCTVDQKSLYCFLEFIVIIGEKPQTACTLNRLHPFLSLEPVLSCRFLLQVILLKNKELKGGNIPNMNIRKRVFLNVSSTFEYRKNKSNLNMKEMYTILILRN